MTTYYIVCTNQKPVDAPRAHQHIVSVGVNTSGAYTKDQTQSLHRVVHNIQKFGDTYNSHRENQVDALVEAVPCPACNGTIIKSVADATTANNLDSLDPC